MGSLYKFYRISEENQCWEFAIDNLSISESKSNKVKQTRNKLMESLIIWIRKTAIKLSFIKCILKAAQLENLK